MPVPAASRGGTTLALPGACFKTSNNVQTMAQLASVVVSQPRFRTVLLGVFASLALALATIGVFGVLSYFVTQRAQEIGVRMALGAQPAAVVRMIVGRGLVLSGTGIVVGLLAAIPLSRSMRSLLFEVPPLDLPTFAGAGVVLAAVAALASYLPARRATRGDPIAALRMEYEPVPQGATAPCRTMQLERGPGNL